MKLRRDGFTVELSQELQELADRDECGYVLHSHKQLNGYKHGYCQNCENEIDEEYDMNFCGKCGKRLKWR